MNPNAEKKIAGILRIALIAVMILLQVLLIYVLVSLLRNYAIYFYFAIEAVAIINIFLLVGRNENPAYTTAWLVVICLIPVFGYILYILWGRSGSSHRNSYIKTSIAYGSTFLKDNPDICRQQAREYPHLRRSASFLSNKNFPLYKNTDCQYLPLGELQFEAMIADLERAEKFIFLEYFILAPGQLWDRISKILTDKAKQGVEVRLMFDDWGSILRPAGLARELMNNGISVVRWGPIHKYVSRLYLNYRNHQKIAVIDGNIGYTGGANLADEYANIYPKHGHWKDTAIRLEGDAVWGLTVTFLQMWDGQTGKTSDYDLYWPVVSRQKAPGYYQPFSDGPINNPDNPAEAMYLSTILNAKEYVYITTPYLVIDNTMMEALSNAATSGVDVRIVTPKIWDHWFVHIVTRSNYGQLIKAGVRIYEYTPGYIHAKTILSDDDNAITGTINMDYRSFNLHFENGVWICGSPVLDAFKRDIADTFEVSQEMDLLSWAKSRPWYIRLLETILRVFAVLL